MCWCTYGCVGWVCWSGVRAKWVVATQNVRTCNFMFHLFLSYSTINQKKTNCTSLTEQCAFRTFQFSNIANPQRPVKYQTLCDNLISSNYFSNINSNVSMLAVKCIKCTQFVYKDKFQLISSNYFTDIKRNIR